MTRNGKGFKIATMYQFIDLPDFSAVRELLEKRCLDNQIKGLLIVSPEGLNGTISGQEYAIDSFLSFLKADQRFAHVEAKISWSADIDPMERLRVLVRNEIVTMGRSGIDPLAKVGQYVEPDQWNDFVDDPKTCVIDTRNQYEVSIGTFEGAIDPHTNTFRDFPNWVEKNRKYLATFDRVAMFCTGGIRCEKATSFLLNEGFQNVFHLNGGILNYLSKVKPRNSKWNGQCFVFDKRVSIGHGLEPGMMFRCRGCRQPLPSSAKESPFYEPGVSCDSCYEVTTESQKARYRERKRQVDLAAARGDSHLGQNSGFERKNIALHNTEIRETLRSASECNTK